MRRRALLAALFGVAAGCVGGPAARTDSPADSPTATPRTVDGSPEPRDTATPPPTPFPREVAVASVDDDALRDAFGVTATVAVPEPTVTAEDTARVTVRLRSTGGERRLTYTQDECGRNDFRAERDGYALLLFPVDGEWTTEADCPVASRPNLTCGIPVREATVTVPADGALTWRYEVLVPPANVAAGGCVVPGRYRFAREFAAGGATATLTFALSVAGP